MSVDHFALVVDQREALVGEKHIQIASISLGKKIAHENLAMSIPKVYLSRTKTCRSAE